MDLSILLNMYYSRISLPYTGATPFEWSDSANPLGKY
jgi:hypothetical protein